MKLLTHSTLLAVLFLASASVSVSAQAAELKVGDAAPVFKSRTHDGKEFDLASRKGQWTVLFFYPKADTPGCTKQACAFRDSIKVIREKGAEVYGVSRDSVEDQAEFHAKYKLNFPLVADKDGDVVASYGTSMPIIGVSKRWTFIVDPELKIRAIDKDVDPMLDAKKVAEKLAEFQKKI